MQRYERLAKKRRTNRLLNISIGVIAIFIVFFVYRLIINDTENQNAEAGVEQPANSPAINEQEPQNPDTSPSDENNAVAEASERANERVIVPSDEPGVIEAFVNPSWSPIGTVQSEPHTIQFNTASQDWREMVQAVAYATDLVESDMIIWHIGNGGAPNRAIANITTRDNRYRYRVYIEWVTAEGWMPTLVKQLEA